jgi:hypothetical protein
MHLFLGWREMEDRISSIGNGIERFLWGASRAYHTFLVACTDEYPFVLIEIDIGDHAKGIHKSMKLEIVELDELPDTAIKIEFIGEASSPTAFEHLIQSAQDYVREHPHYNALLNNCRTFVEYLIDQIPEFRNSIPRKNGSLLEYYHSQAKLDHPGALVKSKQHLIAIRDLHCHNRQYKYATHLVLNVQLPKEDIHDNNDQVINIRLKRRKLLYYL